MRPYSPAVTREESRDYPRNSKGGLTSLRQHERLPEVPVSIREDPQASLCNLSKTMTFPLQHETWPDSPAVTQEQSRHPPDNLKGGLTPFMQLQRFPEIPTATREEPHVSCRNLKEPCVSHLILIEGGFPCFNLRPIPTFPYHLKRRPISTITTRGESRCSFHRLKGHQVPLQLEIRSNCLSGSQI